MAEPCRRIAQCWRIAQLLNLGLAALALGILPGDAAAQGVTFQATALPRFIRQEGMTEAGEVQITSISNGTILAGSSVDFTFSAVITNDSTGSPSNISLSNNVSCISVACAGANMTAARVGSNILRISFLTDTAFIVSSIIHVSRVRVNASFAVGVGNVTVTISGNSADAGSSPISIINPQRQVGVLRSTITADFNHSTATPSPVTSFSTCSFPNDDVADFFIRLNEVFPAALTTLPQETDNSGGPPPSNGVHVSITITGVPAGLTLQSTGTQLTQGPLAFLDPLPSGIVEQTSGGTPISFTYPVAASDVGQSERTTFGFSLRPSSGSSIPDVLSPVSIQGIVQITPITASDSTIVRFVNNQAGPNTLATISNCLPPRAKGPQLISE